MRLGPEGNHSSSAGGRANVILAGGTESMSRVPYFAEGARWGMRMGDMELVDGMYRDGFNDPLSGLVMGETAENLASRYEIPRAEQDEFALRSQQRAQVAIESGRFADEVLPLEIQSRKGETAQFARDEHYRAGTTIQQLASLPPVFSKNGTVTAGNSSGITDGAAAVVVMSEESLKQFGTEPEARIVDYEIAGVAPEIMGIGPVPAVRALLERQCSEEGRRQAAVLTRHLAGFGTCKCKRWRHRIGASHWLHRRPYYGHNAT